MEDGHLAGRTGPQALSPPPWRRAEVRVDSPVRDVRHTAVIGTSGSRLSIALAAHGFSALEANLWLRMQARACLRHSGGAADVAQMTGAVAYGEYRTSPR